MGLGTKFKSRDEIKESDQTIKVLVSGGLPSNFLPDGPSIFINQEIPQDYQKAFDAYVLAIEAAEKATRHLQDLEIHYISMQSTKSPIYTPKEH